MFNLNELNLYQNGTFADVINHHALLEADTVAYVFGSQKITFQQFNSNVNKLIKAIYSLGLKKSDVIGILSWNCLDYTYILGAALKGGFIASPFNPRLKANELEYLINYSEAKILFVGPEFADIVKQVKPKVEGLDYVISLDVSFPDLLFINDLLARHSPEESHIMISEDDPAIILYTSGTTGLPKGALYTQGCLIDDAKVVLTSIPINDNDKNILALQLFHIAAMESFLTFLYAGTTSIILKSFDPATVMQTVQNEKATVVSLVPTAIAAILALPDLEKYDHSSLTRISYMGSSMPVALLIKAIEKFGLIFCQQYGQTESGPLTCYLPPSAHKVVYGSKEDQEILRSCGHPPLGVQLRIVDSKDHDVQIREIGEIILHSKEIMKEYWHNPEETRKTIIDGWLHTRDIGYFDEKGYIYIADRQQDMIITGGEHVFPREVEEVLYQHPMVAEAAVIGVPDQYWVERVHAVVVLKQDVSITSEELIGFCKQRLARFKAPKSCEFIDALPKNTTGKILKSELRKRSSLKSNVPGV